MSDQRTPRPSGPSFGVKRVVGPVLGDMMTKAEPPARRKALPRMPRPVRDGASPAARDEVKAG